MNMETMTHNLSIRINSQLFEQIHKRPNVNWSLVARTAFHAFLNGQLELLMTPEGPVLRPAPGETEPKTEKMKKNEPTRNNPATISTQTKA